MGETTAINAERGGQSQPLTAPTGMQKSTGGNEKLSAAASSMLREALKELILLFQSRFELANALSEVSIEDMKKAGDVIASAKFIAIAPGADATAVNLSQIAQRPADQQRALGQALLQTAQNRAGVANTERSNTMSGQQQADSQYKQNLENEQHTTDKVTQQ